MKIGEYSFYILVTAILIIVRINKNVKASVKNTNGQRKEGGNWPPKLFGKRNGTLSGLTGDNGPKIYITVNASGPRSHHHHYGQYGNIHPGLFGRRYGSLSGLSGESGRCIYITVNAGGSISDPYFPPSYARGYGSLSGPSGDNGHCIYITVNAGDSGSYQHQYFPTRLYGQRYGTLSGLSGENGSRIQITVNAGGWSSNQNHYFPTRLYGRRNRTLTNLSSENGPRIHITENASRSSSYYKIYGQRGNGPPRLSGRRNGSLSGISGGNGPSVYLTFNSDGNNSTDHDLRQGVTSPPRLSGRKYMKGRSVEYMYEKLEGELMNATYSTSGEGSSSKNNRNNYYNKRLSNKAGGKRYEDIFSSRDYSIFDDIDSEASTFEYVGKITKYGKRSRKDSDSIPTIGSSDRYASSYIKDDFKIKAKSKKRYAKDRDYGTYKSNNKRGGRKTKTETKSRESRNKTERTSS